jgi:hypothetical protein
MRHLQRLFAIALLGVMAPAVVHAQVSTVAVPTDSTSEALRALSIDESGLSVNGRYVRGNHEVAVGDTVRGPLVVVRGNADVRGVVLGNVTAIFGDVTVRDGADVRGGATAWRGRVVVEGGRVRGELRAAPSSVPTVVAPPMTRGEALRLTAGWLAMLLTIGFIALVLASRNLDGTARVLEQDFGKAFLVGVAGQLGFLPLLILTIVALCVTVLGILLVPFVLVAAPIALGGLITLGSARDDRAAMIRALVPGVVLLMAPWAIASLMQGASTSALLVRTAAIGITWVAATAGLGAAILSRAGTGSSRRQTAPIAPSSAGWQTPTPVAGIATARRPVPARPTTTPK